MNWQAIGRVISIAAGAGVVFGLQHGLGWQYYIAIPLGILVYGILRAAFTYFLGSNAGAK
jgi:hypothetical protein